MRSRAKKIQEAMHEFIQKMVSNYSRTSTSLSMGLTLDEPKMVNLIQAAEQRVT